MLKVIELKSGKEVPARAIVFSTAEAAATARHEQRKTSKCYTYPYAEGMHILMMVPYVEGMSLPAQPKAKKEKKAKEIKPPVNIKAGTKVTSQAGLNKGTIKAGAKSAPKALDAKTAAALTAAVATKKAA
jgi:hypothetical protein